MVAALFCAAMTNLIEDAEEMGINIYQAINILSFSKYSDGQFF